MANFTNMVVKHVRAETPGELEKILADINIKHQKMTNVINIVREGAFWYAWYYITIDDREMFLPPREKEKPKRGRPKR